MTEYSLLASDPTLVGIERLINHFWYSTEWAVNRETLEITHPSRPTPAGVRVIRKGKRYRFEMERPPVRVQDWMRKAHEGQES